MFGGVTTVPLHVRNKFSQFGLRLAILGKYACYLMRLVINLLIKKISPWGSVFEEPKHS